MNHLCKKKLLIANKCHLILQNVEGNMHDYAVFGHDRASIGRWLGLASILIAGGLAQLLTLMNELTGFDAFAKATVTTGLVYFALHWVFNKWAWKIPFFEIPNLNGKWHLKGQTLNVDGSTEFNWSGEIGVTQNWKEI